MKIIYRISDAGYDKVKPDYVNNEACLANATAMFRDADWLVIADNCSPETLSMIKQYQTNIDIVSVGHGAGTFNLALDKALVEDDNEIIYFIENDYLHKPNSQKVLEEGFEIGTSFVSLYDHPDKYMCPSRGGPNHLCNGNAENTRVYLSDTCHWKITNSTTMTFAAKVATLKRVESILRKHTTIDHCPRDFQMFLELGEREELLVTPIPGYSTHGECQWLTALTDWSSINS